MNPTKLPVASLGPLRRPIHLTALAAAGAAGIVGVGTVAADPSGDYSVSGAPIKVYYSDMHFWRAEVIRLALFIGNVPFEDVRFSREESRKFRVESKSVTFKALPVIESGGEMLSQTQAIVTYVSKLAGMAPTDAWGQAKVDEAVGGCTDVTGAVASTFSLPAADKVAKRKEMIAPGGRIHMFLSGLETLLQQNGNNGHFAGSELSVADLSLWRMSGWLSSGVIDGIPADFVLGTFPGISKLITEVDANPKVQQWKAYHPKLYKL